MADFVGNRESNPALRSLGIVENLAPISANLAAQDRTASRGSALRRSMFIEDIVSPHRDAMISSLFMGVAWSPLYERYSQLSFCA